MKVARSAIINAPLDKVWALLRDFNSHTQWHPAVAASQIENDLASDEVGCIRRFRLADGAQLREQLITLSDRTTSFTYAIIDSPIPLRDYVATVTLKPVTDGDGTFIDWRCSFTAPRSRRDELEKLVAVDIYQQGMTGIQDYFRTAAREQIADAATVLDKPSVVRNQTVPAKAIMIDAPGGTECMTLRDIMVPPPQAGEVRLRQTYAGVNFFDIHQRCGKHPLASTPATLGVEAAGIVEDIGPGVVGIYPGDRVVYANLPAGSYASIRCVPARWCVPIAAGISDEIAAASLLKGVTAEILLHRIATVKPGDTVLVHAAMGGLGSLVTQWARLLGAIVIGTVSNQDKARAARDLGCDWPIIRNDGRFADQVMDITNGRGVDIVIDGIGQQTLNQSISALARFGTLISVGGVSGSVTQLDICGLTERSAVFARPVFFHYAADSSGLRAMATRFFNLLIQQKITVSISGIYPLSDAGLAHRDLQDGKTTGSLVLKI